MSATLAEKVEALRRLSPVKVRLLEIVAAEMLREAQAKRRARRGYHERLSDWVNP